LELVASLAGRWEAIFHSRVIPSPFFYILASPKVRKWKMDMLKLWRRSLSLFLQDMLMKNLKRSLKNILGVVMA